MSKPYRTQPLTKLDESAGLPILRKRHRIAMTKLGEYVNRLDADFIYEAAIEVGLDECIKIDQKRKSIAFDLTGLQCVSLVAALGALVELRDSAGL